MKHQPHKGLFDEQDVLAKLNTLNDLLPRLGRMIDWEAFRPVLEKAFPAHDPRKGGRPPYDRVMLLKVLVLQRIYDLSDEAAEYQINDRLSFRQFLGLELQHRVPDAKCIWHYREQLRKAKVFDALFDAFVERIEAAGLLLNQGRIVDATMVKAPVQRNSREENERIKQGKAPQGWSPNKARQKDIDARWGSKHGKHHFGYKNHVKVDRHSKLIDNFVVSPANLHDSQALPDLAEDCDAGQQYLADSAYGTPGNHAAMRELEISLQAVEQARRNKPLTRRQRLWNKVRSRVRARVEHVFGRMTMCIKGLSLRCHGLDRAHAQIAMANLNYSFQRVPYLNRNAMGAV
jgi:IS5 family transposase